MEKKARNLTTIAISTDCAEMIDNYCKQYNIKGRKEFVELSAQYFSTGDYDLNDNTIKGISQMETTISRLEALFNTANTPAMIYNQFAQYIEQLNSNKQLLLPPSEQMRAELAITEKVKSENETLKNQLAQVKSQLAQVSRQLGSMKKFVNDINTNIDLPE